MARTMATHDGAVPGDHDPLTITAELGMAQAILAWRHRDGSGFEAFSRHAITTQLRRCEHHTRRPNGVEGRRPSNPAW